MSLPPPQRKKLTLTFCHQISLLNGSKKKTQKWSCLPNLSNSTVQKNGRNLRSSNSESTTSMQCCWPQGRISCPTRKGFSHVSWRQLLLSYQELGIWDHKIGNHIPIIQLLEGGGRVEFLPPFRHLTLGFMTFLTGKLLHMAHQHFMFMLMGLDYLFKQPYFQGSSSPRSLFSPSRPCYWPCYWSFTSFPEKSKIFPHPGLHPPPPSNIFSCLPSQDLQSPTYRLQVISPRQCPDSCENFKYPPLEV